MATRHCGLRSIVASATQFFAWRPYLHRYPGVRADQKSEQAMIDAGAIDSLGFRYVGTRI